MVLHVYVTASLTHQIVLYVRIRIFRILQSNNAENSYPEKTMKGNLQKIPVYFTSVHNA